MGHYFKSGEGALGVLLLGSGRAGRKNHSLVGQGSSTLNGA